MYICVYRTLAYETKHYISSFFPPDKKSCDPKTFLKAELACQKLPSQVFRPFHFVPDTEITSQLLLFDEH